MKGGGEYSLLFCKLLRVMYEELSCQWSEPEECCPSGRNKEGVISLKGELKDTCARRGGCCITKGRK